MDDTTSSWKTALLEEHIDGARIADVVPLMELSILREVQTQEISGQLSPMSPLALLEDVVADAPLQAAVKATVEKLLIDVRAQSVGALARDLSLASTKPLFRGLCRLLFFGGAGNLEARVFPLFVGAFDEAIESWFLGTIAEDDDDAVDAAEKSVALSFSAAVSVSRAAAFWGLTLYLACHHSTVVPLSAENFSFLLAAARWANILRSQEASLVEQDLKVDANASAKVLDAVWSFVNLRIGGVVSSIAAASAPTDDETHRFEWEVLREISSVSAVSCCRSLVATAGVINIEVILKARNAFAIAAKRFRQIAGQLDGLVAYASRGTGMKGLVCFVELVASVAAWRLSVAAYCCCCIQGATFGVDWTKLLNSAAPPLPGTAVDATAALRPLGGTRKGLAKLLRSLSESGGCNVIAMVTSVVKVATASSGNDGGGVSFDVALIALLSTAFGSAATRFDDQLQRKIAHYASGAAQAKKAPPVTTVAAAFKQHVSSSPYVIDLQTLVSAGVAELSESMMLRLTAESTAPVCLERNLALIDRVVDNTDWLGIDAIPHVKDAITEHQLTKLGAMLAANDPGCAYALKIVYVLQTHVGNAKVAQLLGSAGLLRCLALAVRRTSAAPPTATDKLITALLFQALDVLEVSALRGQFASDIETALLGGLGHDDGADELLWRGLNYAVSSRSKMKCALTPVSHVLQVALVTKSANSFIIRDDDDAEEDVIGHVINFATTLQAQSANDLPLVSWWLLAAAACARYQCATTSEDQAKRVGDSIVAAVVALSEALGARAPQDPDAATRKGKKQQRTLPSAAGPHDLSGTKVRLATATVVAISHEASRFAVDEQFACLLCTTSEGSASESDRPTNVECDRSNGRLLALVSQLVAEAPSSHMRVGLRFLDAAAAATPPINVSLWAQLFEATLAAAVAAAAAAAATAGGVDHLRQVEDCAAAKKLATVLLPSGDAAALRLLTPLYRHLRRLELPSSMIEVLESYCFAHRDELPTEIATEFADAIRARLEAADAIARAERERDEEAARARAAEAEAARMREEAARRAAEERQAALRRQKEEARLLKLAEEERAAQLAAEQREAQMAERERMRQAVAAKAAEERRQQQAERDAEARALEAKRKVVVQREQAIGALSRQLHGLGMANTSVVKLISALTVALPSRVPTLREALEFHVAGQIVEPVFSAVDPLTLDDAEAAQAATKASAASNAKRGSDGEEHTGESERVPILDDDAFFWDAPASPPSDAGTAGGRSHGITTEGAISDDDDDDFREKRRIAMLRSWWETRCMHERLAVVLDCFDYTGSRGAASAEPVPIAAIGELVSSFDLAARGLQTSIHFLLDNLQAKGLIAVKKSANGLVSTDAALTPLGFEFHREFAVATRSFAHRKKLALAELQRRLDAAMEAKKQLKAKREAERRKKRELEQKRALAATSKHPSLVRNTAAIAATRTSGGGGDGEGTSSAEDDDDDEAAALERRLMNEIDLSAIVVTNETGDSNADQQSETGAPPVHASRGRRRMQQQANADEPPREDLWITFGLDKVLRDAKAAAALTAEQIRERRRANRRKRRHGAADDSDDDADLDLDLAQLSPEALAALAEKRRERRAVRRAALEEAANSRNITARIEAARQADETVKTVMRNKRNNIPWWQRVTRRQLQFVAMFVVVLSIMALFIYDTLAGGGPGAGLRRR